MGYQGIDFAPQPAQGSNPFEPLVQGLGLGLNTVQNIQQIQQNQILLKQKKEEEAILARERRNKDFKEGLELLKDRKFVEGFPEEIQNDVLRSQMLPYLNQDLGLSIDPNITFNRIKPIKDQAIMIFESKAPDNMKVKALAQLGLRADPEEQKQLKAAIEMAFPNTGINQKTGRVTKEGYPIYFNPAVGYAYKDPITDEEIPTSDFMPPQQNPSAGAESDLRDVYSQESLLKEAKRTLTPDKVGLIDKRWKTIGSYIEQSTDPEAIYFRSIIELANTMQRKAFYGATLTNNELKAFRDIAANRDLSPSAFLAQINAMEFSFAKVKKALEYSAQRANRPFKNIPEVESREERLKRLTEELQGAKKAK